MARTNQRRPGLSRMGTPDRPGAHRTPGRTFLPAWDKRNGGQLCLDWLGMSRAVSTL